MNSLKNTDNKSTLSIDTESQYSATSPDLQTGGLMSWLFGSGSGDYATELSLDAFKNQYPQIGYFVIRHAIEKSVALNFSATDNNKCNLVHHIVNYCNNKFMKELLIFVLSNTDAKNHVNSQDGKGNTPAHYAVNNKQNDVVTLLVEYGADLSVRNNAGVSIGKHGVIAKQDNIDDIFVKLSTKKHNSSGLSDVEKRLDRIVRSFVAKSDSDTINFTMTDKPKSQQPVIKIAPQSNILPDTQTVSMDSEDILNMIINEANGEQLGGAKKKDTFGRRSIVTYSELSVGGGDSEDVDSDNEEDDDLSEISSIARAVDNQASDAHKRSIEKIMEIMEVNESDARAYKAVLYDEIKKEKELSNYDRAMELEKRASDENLLKNISKKALKDMTKIISERDEQRKLRESSKSDPSQSEPASEQKKRKPKAKKNSETSISSESGLNTLSTIEIE